MNPKTPLPKVIIFGRANVGKSTLFNRLIEQPKALISKLAGTTRDINIGQIYWQGINFELQDTGGIETIITTNKLKTLSPALNIQFALDIIKKTQAALKKADLILFTVDVQAGLMPQDKELMAALKKFYPAKKVLLVANKADSLKLKAQSAEFYRLGLGEPYLVSGLNGTGTGDLLDEAVNALKKMKKARIGKKVEIPKAMKISIIGKPNVGKSSLLNALLGEEKAIVSPIPFTTREAIDTLMEYKGQNIILIDTAGIRKQAKKGTGLEIISVASSIHNAKLSDVCFLVIDISQPLSVQDKKLSEILMEAQKSIIIIANKWDLIKSDDYEKSKKDFTKFIYANFPYLTWAPVIFVSALSHKNVHHVLDLALEVYQARQIKIKDNALSKFLKRAIKKHAPDYSKIYGRTFFHNFRQVKTNPPRFTIEVRKKDVFGSGYVKYLENYLREEFKIIGTPISIEVNKGKE